MNWIRIALVVFITILNGHTSLIEAAEWRRENSDQRVCWIHETDIKILNNAYIAKRTRKEIQFHNQREFAYRKKHEARLRYERNYPVIKK